jgi:hypothetical protein
MGNLVKAAVVVAVLGTAGVARAGGLPRTHDGFYLNLEGGLGALSTSVTASNTGNDVKLSGAAGLFGIALGGAVTPNFVIGGRLWGTAASDPDLEINGQSGSTTDTSLGLTGIGLDLTYYLMPINIYFQATPSIGLLSVKEQGTSYDFDSGFAIRLAVGKEWWVSDNWGIGLNLQYAHSSNDGKDLPGTWRTNWFGVAFSATYN